MAAHLDHPADHPFWRAVREWQAAWQAFSESPPEYLDYHIWRLKAAEEQLSLVLQRLRAEAGLARPKSAAEAEWAKPPES
ncbi:MAG: hypothetical protein K6U14_04715 [Firmicutes bacterium]|nr:hypothetical protein [Alicyclobacillaceae bacterium]MCL6496922.1 hypothetical protein [Bacillota bacterium]